MLEPFQEFRVCKPPRLATVDSEVTHICNVAAKNLPTSSFEALRYKLKVYV